MDHIAHIKNTGGLDNESVTEETVSEHCKKTALLARSYSAPFNMESTVFVSALLHDSGKLNNDFDGYIKHANGIKRGEIDHSYAGAKFLLELVSNDDDKYKKEVARLIARIIISHHGLNDWYTRNNDDYFDYRCSKNERYDEIKSNISELTSDSELDELLNKAADEYRRFFEKMKEMLSATQNAKSGKPRDKPKLSGINQHKADCYAVCCVSQVVYPARCSKVSCQKNRCVFAPIFCIC